MYILLYIEQLWAILFWICCCYSFYSDISHYHYSRLGDVISVPSGFPETAQFYLLVPSRHSNTLIRFYIVTSFYSEFLHDFYYVF